MRKFISIIILINFICAMTFITYAVDDIQNNTNTTTENQTNTNDINQLQEQKTEIENQVQEAEQQLEEIDTSLSENLQQIAKIDLNIQSTEETLAELNLTIEEIENQIDELQQELDDATKRYDEQQEVLNQRLIAIYKSGDTQYLDVLLNSTSLTDFISSYFLIGEVVQYDKNLLENVATQKEELETKTTKISTERENLNTQKQTQLKTQKVLENTKSLREGLIEKLSIEEQETQSKIDEYYKQIEEIETEIKELAVTESFGEDYIGGTMVWPIPGHYTITSNYGMRTHPITGVYKLHTGVDISAKTGDNFVAMAYGVVTKAGYNSAYGNMVIIDHGGGVQTLYAHGSSIEVEVGDIVNAGDVVLKVGSTGYSTGPHAHFEIRINGETVNPLDYVSIPDEENTE